MPVLVDIVNTKQWRLMDRQEQALTLHQVEKQMSAMVNQLAFDVTAGMRKAGVPCHLEVSYKLVMEPGKDPRHDA